MKQVTQSFKTGQVAVKEVPIPALRVGGILVRNLASLVSAGTERMVHEFARKNLLQKAQARPDLARQVLDKVRREGLLTAVEQVRNRLDQPMGLGYSSAGIVSEVALDVSGFRPRDRVACGGGGYAEHSEIAFVPANLAVRLPENVDFESAAFATLGAIALQGVRQADVRLGEKILVIGLGLLGQLSVQMLQAAGCRVAGTDLKPERCRLAIEMGADTATARREELEAIKGTFTQGLGFDAVLIAADTESSDPVILAGEMARERAVIVAVGAVGMEIPRRTYYQKELDFRLSRSYGPGRYNPEYEEKGRDYPYSYVRWTEGRNLQAVVDLLASNRLNVKPLITHRFPISEASKAYELISGQSREPFLGVLIEYREEPVRAVRIELKSESQGRSSGKGSEKAASIGFLGAGNFAGAVLLPALQKIPATRLQGICSATGYKARHAGDKFGFQYCATDPNEILHDPEINTIFIVTPHNQHAGQVRAALSCGKHIFCEKPLATREEDLRTLLETLTAETGRIVTVGFNRRFAPMVGRIRDFFAGVQEPLLLNYRINAGYIPAEHWVQDSEIGGGRIIGEVCHFVDLLTFLTESLPVRISAGALPNLGRYRDDNLVARIEFANGSVGNITYVASGDTSLPKERLEVFGGGCVAVLDDFRSLELRRDGKCKTIRARLRQDKGHAAELSAFIQAVTRTGVPPIPIEDIAAVSLATFAIRDSVREKRTIEV